MVGSEKIGRLTLAACCLSLACNMHATHQDSVHAQEHACPPSIPRRCNHARPPHMCHYQLAANHHLQSPTHLISTKWHSPTPRDSASMPTAPVPANKSSHLHGTPGSQAAAGWLVGHSCTVNTCAARHAGFQASQPACRAPTCLPPPLPPLPVPCPTPPTAYPLAGPRSSRRGS